MVNTEHQAFNISVALAGLCAVLVAMPVAGQSPEPAGQLHVATTPVGAAVLVDGTARGSTPVTIGDMAAGRHLLQLTKPGYREVRRTVSVGSGRQEVLDVKLESVMGLVLIKSAPPGANVVINDIDRGKTPLLITDLPLGEYRVTVSAAGYLAKELAVTISDRTPLQLEAELVSDSATLRLSSVPSGATVLVNGIARGETPCTVERIPEGAAGVEVCLDGYATYSQNVKLTAGQQEEITVTLQQLPATLRVVSIPSGARIYVDNQFRGATPLVLEDMKPGAYRVRAELPSHEPVARTVQLGNAQALVEEFRLTANVGALDITTQPAGVNVFVDGKPVGTTIAKPDQTDQVSEPLNVRMLASGPHDVRLTKSGYRTLTISLTVMRDRTITRHLQLDRMFIPDCEVRTSTDVVRGVLIHVDPQGNVKLEIRPGVVKIIPADQIHSRRPLRLEDNE